MRKRKLGWLVLVLYWGISMMPVVAMGQSGSTFIPDKLQLKAAKKEGWFPDLNVGLNVAFNQSDGVVGVPNGTTLSFGLQLEAGLLFAHGPHEWRNNFKLLHTQTKIPTIKPFLKAADQATLESIYTFRFAAARWFGLFASLRADTALLEGYLAKEVDTKVQIKEVNGSLTQDVTKAQTPYKLTPGLSPFLLKQSLGAVFRPIEQPWLDLAIKIGAGAVQVWAQSGIRVEDDAKTTDVIELARLQDYIQVGVELKLELKGVLLNKILNYSFHSGVMMPFYTNIATTLSTLELINFDMLFKLSIQVAKWLSINYSLSLLYAPLIQPKLQAVNNLVLSFTINIL